MFKPVETLRVHLPANGPAELREGSRLWTFQHLSETVWKSLETVASGEKFESLPSPKLQTFLLKEHLIFKIQNFQEDQNHRTKYWLAYQSPQADQVFRSLQSKTVAILGCGGTGGLIAEHLVRAGVRSLILVDNGHVDAPDLNRQLHFTQKDLGKTKVAALKERLLQIQPDTQLEVHHTLLVSIDQIVDLLGAHSIDLLICAVDQPMYKIQALVGEAALILQIPVLFGAVGIFDAVIGPLFTDSTELEKQNRSFWTIAEEDTSTVEVVRGSLCFTNTLAAAHMGLEAYKFLTGYGAELTIKNKALIVPYSV